LISRKFVEDAPRIGPKEILRQLVLHPGGAKVQLVVEIDGAGTHHRIGVTTTRVAASERRRWWWVCPTCGRRAKHLYPLSALQCRRCAESVNAFETVTIRI